MIGGGWHVTGGKNLGKLRLYAVLRHFYLLGLLLLPALAVAQASDLDDLLSALKRAKTLAARGQVQVTVNFPPRNPPTRSAKELPVMALRPALIEKNFEVVRGTTEMIAGRSAIRFELTPKNTTAPRWTLWVDQAWNIPLAYEERYLDGSLARQAIFQKVNPKVVKVQIKVPATAPGLRAAVVAALPGFQLPPGFVPSSVKQVSQRWEITLTDGINVLSLVTAPRNVQAAAGVASRQVGSRFVWLVGNLPQDVLTNALAGIKQVDETGLGTFLSPAVSNP